MITILAYIDGEGWKFQIVKIYLYDFIPVSYKIILTSKYVIKSLKNCTR